MFYKTSVDKITPDGIEYTRHEWIAKSEQLTNENVRIKFIDYLNSNNL